MSFATALVLKGATKRLKILCTREIQGSIRESVKAEIEDAIERCGLSAFYDVLETEIRGRNGTEFIFAGLRRHNASAVKSTKGVDIAWVEEASAVSQSSIDILDPTIRKPGSEIWFTWNPDQPTDPVDSIFRNNILPPGTIVREVNFDDNPWFGDTPLLAKMEYDRGRDPDKYQHIWRGQYLKNSEARVFKNYRIETFETPRDAILRRGADWGYSVDPTVLVSMFIGRWEGGKAVSDPTGNVLFIDDEAYAVGCEIDDTPALFAGTDKLGRWENPNNRPGIADATKWLITADSNRPDTVSYMKRRGFKIAAAVKGAGSIEDGISFLKMFDIVIHPRCVQTADEFATYSWRIDPLTGEILPILGEKKNHVIDSCRYACEAVRRTRRPPAGPANGKPRDYKSGARQGGSEWMAA